MNSRIFFWNVLARVGLILATAFGFIWLIDSLVIEWLFTLVAGGILLVFQVILLTRYIMRISQVMEQFIDAVGNEDSPEVRFSSGGLLFNKLENRANALKEGIVARRLEKEKDDRILISAINSADFGLVCFDSQGEVLFANETLRGMLSSSELKRLDQVRVHDVKIWETMSQIRPGSPRVLRLSTDGSLKAGQGRDRLVSIRLKELKVFEENFRLFSFHDIQEELHRNESDSWQKIIRVLTHEIMNAVAPMLSLTRSLQNRLETGKEPVMVKIADGLRTIENTGKGLIDFTEEYRRLSLLPLPKKENMALTPAINRVLLLFEKEARDKAIKLTSHVEGSGAEIYADPQQLEMVLLNLVKNAFESFEKSGRNQRVDLRAEMEKNRVVVTVEDNGCGIPGKMLDQVFVPFFSTKENGSGIGLSLARQILTNHEASIQLESAPDQGTRVRLLF